MGNSIMLSGKEKSGLTLKTQGGDGLFKVGTDGVDKIYQTKCKKLEFIEYQDKTLSYVPSSLGYPAIYPLKSADYSGDPLAVLMDLDGTSVHSEEFWMFIIKRTMADLLSNPKFSLEPEDIPFISGHSVSEHLQYCINKYAKGKQVEEARGIYHKITAFEMNEIMEGRGEKGAFTPAPFLKEFLLALKERNIRVGLVTSGLYAKAMPEIVSAFTTLGMGDPLGFVVLVIVQPVSKIRAMPAKIKTCF